MMSAALVERTAVVVKRRKLLGGLFALGAGIFGIVAMFPLLRSLGPLPGDTLAVTNWRKGTHVGRLQRPAGARGTLVVGGIMTVYPRGRVNTDEGQAVDQTVLIRVQRTDFTTVPGRETWAPAGYVAYSKACTHLGCPVGLYEQELSCWCARATNPCSTCATGPSPSSGPPPAPCPSCP